MSDNNLTSPLLPESPLSFEQALERSPTEDLCASTPGSSVTFERIVCSLVIIGFLSLATIVGVAELPVVPESIKGNLISLGAPIGMRQGWRVFSPELRSHNWHTLCIVEMQDGTLKAVEFPRMQKLSLLERFVHFKKESLLGDHLPNHIYKRFRPAVARYYARANAGTNTDRPVRINFVFASVPIPPLESTHWIYRDRLPEHIFKQVYFSYGVKDEDLNN